VPLLLLFSMYCGLREPNGPYALYVKRIPLVTRSSTRSVISVSLLKLVKATAVHFVFSRHPFMTATVNYSYMLWPKTRGQYQVARCAFAHEKMEDYYWNHHDEYVCYPDDHVQQSPQTSVSIVVIQIFRLRFCSVRASPMRQCY